jgi:hypothetical protein
LTALYLLFWQQSQIRAEQGQLGFEPTPSDDIYIKRGIYGNAADYLKPQQILNQLLRVQVSLARFFWIELRCGFQFLAGRLKLHFCEVLFGNFNFPPQCGH